MSLKLYKGKSGLGKTRGALFESYGYRSVIYFGDGMPGFNLRHFLGANVLDLDDSVSVVNKICDRFKKNSSCKLMISIEGSSGHSKEFLFTNCILSFLDKMTSGSSIPSKASSLLMLLRDFRKKNLIILDEPILSEESFIDIFEKFKRLNEVVKFDLIYISQDGEFFLNSIKKVNADFEIKNFNISHKL